MISRKNNQISGKKGPEKEGNKGPKEITTWIESSKKKLIKKIYVKY